MRNFNDLDRVVEDMPIRGRRDNPRGYQSNPWGYLAQTSKSTINISGTKLKPLVDDIDLAYHLFRVEQYGRLFEGAIEAYKIIKPEVTQKLLDETREIAFRLTSQSDLNGREVVTEPGKVDPVLDGLLAQYETKRKAVADGLRDDRTKSARAGELPVWRGVGRGSVT